MRTRERAYALSVSAGIRPLPRGEASAAGAAPADKPSGGRRATIVAAGRSHLPNAPKWNV
jgi:hypothetical protein